MADGSGFGRGLGALRGEAPHALRDNAAETVRGILVVALAYLAFTAGDVAEFADLLQRLPKPVLAFCRTGTRSGKLYRAAVQARS